MGDFTYGDDFSPVSTYYGASGSGGSNVQKWDSWAPMWQSVTGNALLINAVGNHELEVLSGYPYNSVKYTDGPYQFGMNVTGTADNRNVNIPMQGYTARFPDGARSNTQIGDLYNTWYAQAVGPVMVIVLNNFMPFAVGTDQYNFFTTTLAAINRVATPWLIVTFHSPPYHSYYTHYKEMDCACPLPVLCAARRVV